MDLSVRRASTTGHDWLVLFPTGFLSQGRFGPSPLDFNINVTSELMPGA